MNPYFNYPDFVISNSKEPDGAKSTNLVKAKGNEFTYAHSCPHH